MTSTFSCRCESAVADVDFPNSQSVIHLRLLAWPFPWKDIVIVTTDCDDASVAWFVAICYRRFVMQQFVCASSVATMGVFHDRLLTTLHLSRKDGQSVVSIKVTTMPAIVLCDNTKCLRHTRENRSCQPMLRQYVHRRSILRCCYSLVVADEKKDAREAAAGRKK